MSRRMVTDLLRNKLGFQGLILTDCMEMLAIQNHYGTPQGVVAAIRAGVDLAEISSRMDLEEASAKAVNEAAARGELNLQEIQESVERILKFKQQLFTAPDAALCNLQRDRQAAWNLSRQAVTQVGGNPFRADEHTFFCGCADYRVSGAANEDGKKATFPEFMAQHFGARCLVTSKDPTEEEIQEVVRQAAGAEKIVLGTCNGHLFAGQQQLAAALSRLQKPMAVVALRNPYDLSGLPETLWKLCSYDYDAPALAGVAEVLSGGAATGVCPVKL